MRKPFLILLLVACCATLQAAKVYKPWENGRLTVSANHLYLVHENGTNRDSARNGKSPDLLPDFILDCACDACPPLDLDHVDRLGSLDEPGQKGLLT